MFGALGVGGGLSGFVSYIWTADCSFLVLPSLFPIGFLQSFVLQYTPKPSSKCE